MTSRSDKAEKHRVRDRERYAASEPHRLKARAQAKAWAEANRERSNQIKREWQLNHNRKHKAHHAVYVALQKGELKKQPCELCGKEETEAHHDDYTMPLCVRWLCKAHHYAYHQQERARRAAARAAHKSPVQGHVVSDGD